MSECKNLENGECKILNCSCIHDGGCSCNFYEEKNRIDLSEVELLKLEVESLKHHNTSLLNEVDDLTQIINSKNKTISEMEKYRRKAHIFDLIVEGEYYNG